MIPQPTDNLHQHTPQPTQPVDQPPSIISHPTKFRPTPLEYIPSEILADIFAIAANGTPVHFPPDFTCSQWVLTRVCGRWRHIARNESRLWNSISITNALNTKHDPKSLELALKYVPPRGLLSIAAEDISRDTNSRFSTSVMNLLVIPHLSRIKLLKLHLQSSGYPQFFASSPESLKSIEFLELSFHFFVINDAIVYASQDTTIFDMALKLRTLNITSSYGHEARRFANNLLNASIPWYLLTSLDFRPSPLSLTSLQFILRQLTILESLTASVADNNQLDQDPPKGSITLPHLKTLSLWLLGGGRVFRHLLLPALNELHLEGLFRPPPYADISYMISRSGCRLTVFKGGGRAPHDTSAMHDLMSLLPEVREFNGKGLMVEEVTLRMIGRGELLPRVSVLSCDFECPKAFADALEMRLELGMRESEGTGVVSLQTAGGHCPRGGQYFELDVYNVMARLDKLNEKFKTQYSLELVPGPLRDL